MTTINWLPFNPSPEDSRDHIATFSSENYYSYVDLLPDVEEVENQYQTSSCTANAAASALEIAYKRAGQSKDFSRLYNYWYSRQIGGISGDSGAYPRDVCKALNQYGICLESSWEFDIQKNLNVEPSKQAQEEAIQYPIYEYSRLSSDDLVGQIKQSVASGIPVMTSIKVSKLFNGLGPKWKEHDWDPTIDFLGAHQVLIIGYDDQSQRFLAQNSWGNFWGDGGFFGIPYNRVGKSYSESDKSAYEYWILNKLAVPYYSADGKETNPSDVTDKKQQTTYMDKIILASILFFIAIYYISGN